MIIPDLVLQRSGTLLTILTPTSLLETRRKLWANTRNIRTILSPFIELLAPHHHGESLSEESLRRFIRRGWISLLHLEVMVVVIIRARDDVACVNKPGVDWSGKPMKIRLSWNNYPAMERGGEQ